MAAALFLLGLAGAFFPTFRLPWEAYPVPGIPIEPSGVIIFPLAALAWVLAAGLLNPASAGILGLWHGLLLSLYVTHSPYAILETAGLAMIVSAGLRQRYRTHTYAVMRHPLGALLINGLYFVIVFLFTAFASAEGRLPVRIDYAVTRSWPLLSGRMLEIFSAGLFAEAVYLLRFPGWVRRDGRIPSPPEVSIQARFFYRTMPYVGFVFLALFGLHWWLSGQAIRRDAEARLGEQARQAAQLLPLYLDTGTSLITRTAAQLSPVTPASSATQELLAQGMAEFPFFSQFVLADPQGTVLNGYPETSPTRIRLQGGEHTALRAVVAGVTGYREIVPAPAGLGIPVGVFAAPVLGKDGQVEAILLGRADLDGNPYAGELLGLFRTVEAAGGQALLHDGRIALALTEQANQLPRELPAVLSPGPSESRSPQGAREFLYTEAVRGTPWLISFSYPESSAQLNDLRTSGILFAALALVVAGVLASLGYTLRGVSTTIRHMSAHASRIMMGDLERPILSSGADEVGRLADTLEEMRQNLKNRLDELSRLLMVSQSVASNLEIQGAIRPILAASLTGETTSSRVVLVPQVGLDPSQERLVTIGSGPSAELFAYLDSQLFELSQEQDVLTVPNVSRMRRLIIPAGNPFPGAVAAFAIRHNERYFGSFWVAFDQKHNFTEEEIRYWRSLGEEINLAAASSSLYAIAEVERRRLEGAFSANTDAVLILGAQDRLLLANPAARKMEGLIIGSGDEKKLESWLGIPALVKQLNESQGGIAVSQELSLPNGKSFVCSIAPLLISEQEAGRVCTLFDVTYFKETDQKKTEFLATACHDLRSPLTHVRGYASMLQATGDLNDNQKGYAVKLVRGVEQMTRIVNNLLDLGNMEGGQPLVVTRFPILQLIQDAVAAQQVPASQKDIEVGIDSSPQLAGLMMEGDRALLLTALGILLDNAVRYTGQRGIVRVRMEARPATVILQVVDNGVGIAPLDLPRMFEKFTRIGRRGMHTQHGSGLGLAIAKTIVDRHMGQLWVDSTLGKGSTFSMELPLRRSQAQAEAQKAPSLATGARESETP